MFVAYTFFINLFTGKRLREIFLSEGYEENPSSTTDIV